MTVRKTEVVMISIVNTQILILSKLYNFVLKIKVCDNIYYTTDSQDVQDRYSVLRHIPHFGIVPIGGSGPKLIAGLSSGKDFRRFSRHALIPSVNLQI